MKREPQRTCIGCKEKKNQKDLIKIVCNKDGKIDLDKEKKMQGRGAYICNKKDCLENAIKTRGFERALKTKIDEEIYKSLRDLIIE